jgi:predicted RNA methylase
MPNGLALAALILIAALVSSYVITLLLSLLLSPSHTQRDKLKELVKDLDLKDGDTFVDLGCGDGRVVFEVAKNFKKVNCIGYEISPIHIMIAKLSRMILFPFSNRVRIVPENFMKVDLSNVDVVYVNWGKIDSPSMEKFRKELKKNKNIKVVEL